jgi:hypothetical protein
MRSDACACVRGAGTWQHFRGCRCCASSEWYLALDACFVLHPAVSETCLLCSSSTAGRAHRAMTGIKVEGTCLQTAPHPPHTYSNPRHACIGILMPRRRSPAHASPPPQKIPRARLRLERDMSTRAQTAGHSGQLSSALCLCLCLCVWCKLRARGWRDGAMAGAACGRCACSVCSSRCSRSRSFCSP